MDSNTPAFKFKLGLFIIIGASLLFLGIFIIGKQKNLFDPVISVKANFKNVSGLQVGNMVRFSGINVGTIENILIINDSTVRVDMLIKKEVQKFIKADSQAVIGSEGLIGDKLVMITQGENSSAMVKNNQLITSIEPIETDAIMRSVQETAENAAIATDEIAEIVMQINRGEGTLGRLIKDKSMADNIDKTILNLKKSSKGLDENMEAAKHNFLLRGYFKKKEKKAEKARKAAEKKAEKARKKAEKEAEKNN